MWVVYVFLCNTFFHGICFSVAISNRKKDILDRVCLVEGALMNKIWDDNHSGNGIWQTTPTHSISETIYNFSMILVCCKIVNINTYYMTS